MWGSLRLLTAPGRTLVRVGITLNCRIVSLSACLSAAVDQVSETMELLTALHAASEAFRQRLVLVGPCDWVRSTPCSEWDVRYLTAHVVGGNRFAVSIMGGLSASEAMDEVMSSPQLADDALSAWTTTSAEQLDAFGADGMLERKVAHPLGSITGREFLAFRVFDVTLHAWDLARALGAEDQLEPELVDAVLAIIENGPPGMGFDVPVLGVAGLDSPPQERLLDLTGRRRGAAVGPPPGC